MHGTDIQYWLWIFSTNYHNYKLKHKMAASLFVTDTHFYSSLFHADSTPQDINNGI